MLWWWYTTGTKNSTDNCFKTKSGISMCLRHQRGCWPLILNVLNLQPICCKTATFMTRSKPDYRIICKAHRNVKQLNKVAKKRSSEICQVIVGGRQRQNFHYWEKENITLLIPFAVNTLLKTCRSSQTWFYVLNKQVGALLIGEPSHHFTATSQLTTSLLLSDVHACNSRGRFQADFIDSSVADSFKVQLSIGSTS